MAATLRQKLKSVAVRIGLHTGPSFLIIGAQKCGSTALYKYLRQHPLIVTSTDKEMNYFAQDRLYDRGRQWYHEQFPTRLSMPSGGVSFEATPEYLYYPQCPPRIRDYKATLPLVVLVRDPVERAYSAWNMARGWYHNGDSVLRAVTPKFDDVRIEKFRRLLALPEFPDFDTAIREEMDRMDGVPIGEDFGWVRRGLYALQLRRYLELFPRSQILVLHSRRLRSDRVAVLNEVTKFLGLPRHDWADADLTLQHEGRYSQEDSSPMQGLLREFFRPHNEQLYELMGTDLGWQ